MGTELKEGESTEKEPVIGSRNGRVMKKEERGEKVFLTTTRGNLREIFLSWETETAGEGKS